MSRALEIIRDAVEKLCDGPLEEARNVAQELVEYRGVATKEKAKAIVFAMIKPLGGGGQHALRVVAMNPDNYEMEIPCMLPGGVHFSSFKVTPQEWQGSIIWPAQLIEAELTEDAGPSKIRDYFGLHCAKDLPGIAFHTATEGMEARNSTQDLIAAQADAWEDEGPVAIITKSPGEGFIGSVRYALTIDEKTGPARVLLTQPNKSLVLAIVEKFYIRVREQKNYFTDKIEIVTEISMRAGGGLDKGGRVALFEVVP